MYKAVEFAFVIIFPGGDNCDRFGGTWVATITLLIFPGGDRCDRFGGTGVATINMNSKDFFYYDFYYTGDEALVTGPRRVPLLK